MHWSLAGTAVSDAEEAGLSRESLRRLDSLLSTKCSMPSGAASTEHHIHAWKWLRSMLACSTWHSAASVGLLLWMCCAAYCYDKSATIACCEHHITTLRAMLS